jgi:broad specificity phosphatase PhoE
MVKTLILIRHGHRDNSVRSLDNGLSDKGREQAKAIKKFFSSRFGEEELKSGVWFVSSPKLRCVETILPAAKACQREVDAHPLLDEQSTKENGGGLEERVQTFLSEWKKSTVPLTVVSSHGDWLPAAMFRLVGLHFEPKKGSWFEIEWNSGAAALKWYIPTFKHFYP